MDLFIERIMGHIFHNIWVSIEYFKKGFGAVFLFTRIILNKIKIETMVARGLVTSSSSSL